MRKVAVVNGDLICHLLYLTIAFWCVSPCLLVPNNITGTLPPEFGHLKDFTHVDLDQQKGLYGSIPSTVGHMKSLQSFSVLFAGPEFGGVIPTELFTAPAIEWITFLYNEGTWEFPPIPKSAPGERFSLRGLHVRPCRDFQARSCGFSGTIPPAFMSEFMDLEHLAIEDSAFGGTLPASIGSLSNLVYLNLNNISLGGTLPPSLGGLSNLTALALGENNFGGALPLQLRDLKKLRLLDLSDNELTGVVPAEFSGMSSLEHVSLQNNNLHGSISAFEGLSNLASLLLYSNNFNSTIPSGLFSNFSTRIWADLGHNDFTGELPLTFEKFASNTSEYVCISPIVFCWSS